MVSVHAKNLIEVESQKPSATYIGVSVARNFDGPAKTSGRAEYINDLSRKGMLYACILRSPIPHGRIRRIDYTELLKKDYIKAVITAENTSFSKIGPIRDNPPLKFEKVRSLQDEILAVATTDPVRAKDDLERDVVVEYDELEPVFDPVRSMEKTAPLIHEESGSNIAKISFSTDSGNVDEAFKKSYYTREDEFDIPRVAFAPMGTLAALAEVDESGTLLFTSNTQQPFQLRRELAEALNIGPESVKIVQPYIGGTFGRGMALQPFEVITAELALRTGKPVKAEFTRSEDFKFSPTRQPVKIRIKTGTSKGGIITSDRKVPLLNLFSRKHGMRLIIVLIVFLFYYVYAYPFLGLTTSLLAASGYTIATSLLVVGLGGLGFALGAFLSFIFADQMERKYLIAILFFVQGLSMWLIGIKTSVAEVVIADFIASFSNTFLATMLYVYAAENFPTSARSNGVAATDGLGHIAPIFMVGIAFSIFVAHGFYITYLTLAVLAVIGGIIVLPGIRSTARKLEDISG